MPMRIMWRAAWPVIALGLASLPCLAGVTLLLEDGQELEGRSLKQEDGMYLLELATDNVLPVPVELVAEVKRTGKDRPKPTGMKVAEAETLVGRPGARLPTHSDQIEALRGNVSVFRPGVADYIWKPTSDWDLDPERNNFNPARWYRPPIDPHWEPQSGLGEDVTHFNPVRWYRAPIDPTWWPTDGFARD